LNFYKTTISRLYKLKHGETLACGSIPRSSHRKTSYNDLSAAKAFFLYLGLEMMGEGEWAEQLEK